MNARKLATQGAIVALPSDSGMAEVAPSASASRRSASAGRPVNARIQAPKTATAGNRARSSSSNQLTPILEQ
jgi:hypothetical protein